MAPQQVLPDILIEHLKIAVAKSEPRRSLQEATEDFRSAMRADPSHLQRYLAAMERVAMGTRLQNMYWEWLRAQQAQGRHLEAGVARRRKRNTSEPAHRRSPIGSRKGSEGR